MAVRKFVDKATGEVLVFPDTIFVSNWKSSTREGSATISAYVTLGVSTAALAQEPRSRPIAMTDLVFNLAGPTDSRVSSFDFVRDKEATGTFVIVTSAQYVDAIKALATGKSDYLQPTFKGLSEEFADEVETGTATLPAASVQEINRLIGLTVAITSLLEALTTHSDNLKLHLADQIIDSYGSVTKSIDGSSYHLRLQEGRTLTARLTAIQPRVESISGDPQTIGVQYVA